MMKYYRWPDGRFIGGFDGVEPPEGAIEVEILPDDGTQIWDGEKWVWPILPVDGYQVDRERDRRISEGFVFEGVRYQTESQSDRENILGALGTALAAITVDGAQAGNLRWADPKFDFFWIAADNSRVPMDAQTCLAFARAAVARKSLLVIAGNNLKQLDPIPQDYTDDKYWPAADSTTRANK